MEERKETKVTKIDKLMVVIGKIQNVCSVIPLVAMCFIVFAGVIMRYVLKIPFTWGEEAARYLMIFASMLAIPEKIRFIVTGFAQILNILFFALLTYFSWNFIVAQYTFGQFSAALKFPMYLVYGMLLLGFGFSCIESLYVFWRDFIRKEPLETKEEII